MNKENKIKYIMNLFFFLYFLILIVERTISVVLSFVNGFNIFQNGFNIFVYLTIFVSFIAFLIYLLVFNRHEIKTLFKPTLENIEAINFKRLVIASGIILLSGMVHSEYTISVIQFTSYGFFIIAIILQGVLMNKTTNSKLLLWFSISFLIALSMAIPVTYETHLSYSVAFHLLSGMTTYLLVAAFTYLTYSLFDGENNLFNIIVILVTVVLDGMIIALKWTEEVNTFVLIFASLSLVLFIPGYIISLKNK